LRSIGRHRLGAAAIVRGQVGGTGQAAGVERHQQALVQADACQRGIEQRVIAALRSHRHLLALMAQAVQGLPAARPASWSMTSLLMS
jgi:predicted 2-oxoglutarate/Fe(II)-dependent dioxygenase YbiX